MLKKIFQTVTWKQSQITVIGSLINGGLGLLFYILLARILGPSDFGLLTVSIVTLTLISDIADFGTNTGLVRHVSAYLNSDKHKALRFLKLSLEIKLLVWIGVLTLGVYLAPVIAQQIFNKPELTSSLRLVMIGVGGALLFSFATSSLQAFQKYFTWSAINIVTNLLRVILIAVLFSFGSLDLQNSVLSYILLPFFGFSLAMFFLPFRKIIQSKNEFSVAKEFLKYNFSVALFTVIAAFSARLDTFLTARLLSTHEIGIYGVANQLIQVIPQVITALGVVAAPKFAGFVSSIDMIRYLKKFQLFVLGICVLGLLFLPIVLYFIPVVFGSQYADVNTPFVVLFIAMLVFLFSIPIHSSIIYYFGKPDVFIWVSVAHLLIIGILGYILISNFGVLGAAFSVLVGTTFNFLAPLTWFLIRLRKK